jgi:hypothetical protein
MLYVRVAAIRSRRATNLGRGDMSVFRGLTRWCAVLMIVGVTAGCGGGGGDGGSPPPPPAPPPSKIFVGDSGTPAIGSSPESNPQPGQVVVERIIEGPNTMLTSSLADFALDVARDRLYVADLRSILVFDNISTADGNVAPSRIVSTCCGGFGNFVGISLDTVNDRLYAGVNLNLMTRQVQVFDNVSALSNSAPTRTATIDAAFLMDVAIDPTKNILYVYSLNTTTNFTQIAVFDSASTLSGGPVTANRTISIGDSFSSGPAVGMFIDPANDRLYAPRGVGQGRVLVFDNASTKNGTITMTAIPERTINLPVPDLTSITVELTANRLYAADTNGVSIIDNASTVNGTPPVVIRALAPAGSIFKAVAVAP